MIEVNRKEIFINKMSRKEPGETVACPPRIRFCALQRTEEVQQVLLLRSGKRIVVRNNTVRFRAVAGVLLDRGDEV